MSMLYSWQEPSAQRLVEILSKGNIALDASETGTGKSYIACEALKRLNRRAVVIAPKSAISMWHRVAEEMGAQLLDVINIEALRSGKGRWYGNKMWHLAPPNNMLIWDECHKGASGPKTITTEMLAFTKAYKVPVLALSATIASNPLKLRALGFLLGLHNYNPSSFYNWCRANGCHNSPFHSGLEFTKRTDVARQCMDRIHNAIQDRMVRIRIEDVPEFPECDTQCNLYDLDAGNTEEINRIYAEMDQKLKEPHNNVLVELGRARQKVELLKVPLLMDLVEDHLEEGKSVVVFCNYTETLKILEAECHYRHLKPSVIHGQQLTTAERDMEIREFQENRTPVCIAMGQAGGVSISLHDIHHQRPRVALITPSYNETEFKQVLGRIHRAGGTKSLQVIVLAAGTIEEKVYSAIQRKLSNLDALTDGDLRGDL